MFFPTMQTIQMYEIKEWNCEGQ